MTTVDENGFFREATLRLCSSLDIETALKRCFEYIGLFMPVIRMDLNILDADLNVLQFVASVGVSLPRGSKQVLPLPEKGRNERATFWKNGGMVKIINEPDPKLALKEIQEKLGLKPDISAMTMDLNLEGNRIGNLRCSRMV